MAFLCNLTLRNNVINMSWAWDKEKIYVPNSNCTYDLLNLWQMVGSIPIGDSDFFLVPCS